MNTEAFLKAYNEPRNGTDTFHFNPMYRRFLYSDGVKECAEAGCYWLLDILGTELPTVFKKHPGEPPMLIEVKVAGQSCQIVGTFDDDGPPVYKRNVAYTDLPPGSWKFLVSDDGEGKQFCILVSEY